MAQGVVDNHGIMFVESLGLFGEISLGEDSKIEMENRSNGVKKLFFPFRKAEMGLKEKTLEKTELLLL